jgi:membrane protein
MSTSIRALWLVGDGAVSDWRWLVEKVRKDNLPMLAAVVSWGVLMAVVPTVVALSAVIGFLLNDPERQREAIQHLSAITHYSMSQSDLRQLVRDAVRHSGLLAVLGAGGIAFGASTVGGAISTVFQPIFGVRGRPILQQKLIDVGMILVFTVLMLVILVATTAGTLLDSLFSHLAISPETSLATGTAVSLVAAFLLFATLYTVFPNIEPRFKRGHIWKGAAVAAILFQILSYVWPLYVTLFRPQRYGLVFAPVVVLGAWIYAFSWILVIGAELVAHGSLAEAQAAGVPVGPAPDGTVPQRTVVELIDRDRRIAARRAEAGDDDQHDGEQRAETEDLVEEKESDERGDGRLEAHEHAEDARGQRAERLDLERVRDHR